MKIFLKSIFSSVLCEITDWIWPALEDIASDLCNRKRIIETIASTVWLSLLMLQSRTENIRWKRYRNKKYSINPGEKSLYNRAKFNLTDMKYKAFPKTNAQTKSKKSTKY